jgi:hypothetical protein
MEKQLREHGDKVSADVRGNIESAVNSLKDALKSEDGDRIKKSIENLNQAAYKLGEEIYKKTGAAPGARSSRSTRPMAAMTTNTIATTSTENAAAGPSESSVMFSNIRTVISVQLIETRKIVALIAVIDRMNTMPRPAKKAGRISGSVMRRNVVPLPAPRLCDASSRLLSICCNSATVARIPVGP